jgi:hypothetical protein
MKLLITIVICSLIGFHFWNKENPNRFNIPARQSAVQTTAVQQQSTHELIEATLWKVAKDLNNKRDMTGNGKSNCEDAAILFYMYYPNKKDVMIYANDNPATGMSHAFNLVNINGTWRGIEPQAYMKGWQHHRTYFMHDIWKSQYDHTKNKNAWDDYGRFVR